MLLALLHVILAERGARIGRLAPHVRGLETLADLARDFAPERVLRRVRGIAITHFSAADVVRHPLVARIVEAYDAADRSGERA